MKRILLILFLIGFLVIFLPLDENLVIPTSAQINDDPIEYLELKQFSSHYHNSDGSIRFSQRAGDQNTWDGSTYQYYIFNEIEKSIQFANSKMFFYDWYSSVEMNDEIVVDDCRWIVQYWSSQGQGSWKILDLYNHYWFDPVVSTKSIEFIQGFNDEINFLNVSYLVSNNAQVKISINFISGEEREVRFIWQLTGMDGNLEVDLSTRIFSFADIIISCNDTEIDINFSYDWIVSTKKLDLIIGNYTVGIGSEVFIDPTFSEKQAVGAYDWRVRNYDGDSYTFYDQNPLIIGTGTSNSWYNGTEGFDTGITESVSSTSDVVFTFSIDSEMLETDEWIAWGLYFYAGGDGDGIWNETEAEADPESACKQICYYSDMSVIDGSVTGDDNNTIDDGEGSGDLMDAWVIHHNSDSSNRQLLPIKLFSGDGCDDSTSDYIGINSAEEVASKRPTLTFTYTIGGEENNAPNNPTLDSDSGNTFAGKYFLVVTNHTDDDGGADIETMYLQHYYSAYNVTIYCFQNSSSGSVTILVGSDYLDSTPAYSHSAITNGYTVTWNITFDWDYVDDTAYTIYARTVDDEPEWSSWANLDSNNLFENDLEVVLLDIAIDGSAEYGGMNGYLNDTDWFRGGVQVTANGIIEYQGSTELFDSAYAAAVDVELYYDGGGTGQKDESISSGVFSAIIYTPTDASGLDTTAYFDIVINDIPSDGSDVTDAGIEITTKRDNEVPTGVISTDSDSASIGYTPNTNYDDDSTIDFTASEASDGSGSGLDTDCYSYNETAWTSSTTKQYSEQSDGNISVFLDIRDNVGNNGSTQETWVIIDTDSPSGFTFTFARHTGIPDGYYCYVSGSTIYFNSGYNDYFTVTINDDGSIQNSAFWFVVWDNNSVFETSAEDQSGLPDEKNFNFESDSSGSFIIRIVNNAGNYQTETYTATEDVVAPTGSFTVDSDSASIGYAPNTNYDDDSTIDFTASGWSDGGSGLPTNCYSYNETAWTSSTTKQYSEQSDENITVIVNVRDYVGNNGSSSDWVIVDTDSPSGYILTWDRVNDTYPCVKNSTGFLFDDGQNNYTTVYINDTGSIQNSAFWFVVWDNNSVLETSTEDQSGLPDNKNFNYHEDDNGTFVILVVNNAGNYQNISVLCYDIFDSGEPPVTTTTTTTTTTDDDDHENKARANNPFNPFPYVERIVRINIPQLFLSFIFLLALLIFWKVMTFWRQN